jgi:hypothetical protein
VRQYQRANHDFPQQSTADQWYDESQFESYRRLGYESALEAMTDVPPAALVKGQFETIPAWFIAHVARPAEPAAAPRPPVAAAPPM